MSTPEVSAGTQAPAHRRPLLFLPLIAFIALAGLFYARLQAGDPSRLPSALVGRPAPAFALPPVPGLDSPGLKDADLRAGHVSLINIFASWCVECHDEHSMLMRMAQDASLKARGVMISGIAYKDNAEDARRYLGAKGNPFAAVGDDSSGRTAIDFGVYGVPETFVIKGDGTIAYKLIGGVTERNLGTVMAAIDQASR
jgi:cytochrome c biogenesis protein CcmG/thiol:disulfide interchange protein DsbE